MAGPLRTTDGVKPWYYCNPPMILGEAPIYRASDSTLHWVDCLNEPPELHILSVDPDTGDMQTDTRARVLKLADSVTVHFFRKNHPGSYICAAYQGVAFLDETTGRLDMVKEIIPTADRDKRRFNDGGIDSRGRFWLAEIDIKAMAYGANGLPASYGEPKGRLWRYDPDGSLHQMGGGLVCGNGLAWSPDDKTMYVNDSVGMKIYKHDYDAENGTISNRKILVDRRDSYGEPDGMVVDTDGNLWVSMYATHSVMVYSPEGKHLRDVKLSAMNPACPTWGGKNRDILFVATASDRENKAGPDDEGGHIFRYKAPAGVKGLPKHEFLG